MFLRHAGPHATTNHLSAPPMTPERVKFCVEKEGMKGKSIDMQTDAQERATYWELVVLSLWPCSR